MSRRWLRWALVGFALTLWGATRLATAGAPVHRFSFVVFGDNQFATRSPTSGVPERMAVPEVVVALKPDLVLHTGDLMDHGYEKGAYDRFVEYYAGMLGSTPLFPTMGNHDAARGGTRSYRAFVEKQLKVRNPSVGGETFRRHAKLWLGDDPKPYPQSFSDPARGKFKPDLPSGVTFKTFYAFRFRNALFLSLEQGTRWWANTPRSWMEKHLRAARKGPGIDHIFVTMHHPMYSTTMRETPPDPKKPSSGECIEPVRRLYEPLFRKYDVTMVFSGHAHLYDRFCVPDDDRATRRDPPPASYPHDGRRVHYIVTGGGGGPLNRSGLRQEHSYRFFQRRLQAYHVTEVRVDGKRLDVRVRRVSGTGKLPKHELFDSFRLEPVPRGPAK